MTPSVLTLPQSSSRLGLGLGMDMPWGATVGFSRNSEHDESRLTERTRLFLNRYQDSFRYAFIAFQPRGRSRLIAEDYFEAYDEFFSYLPKHKYRAFHHTLLNMGTVEIYDRSEILSFTNTLAARYDFAWVVEDLGLWSIDGKTVPFPLPPFMTREGFKACLSNIKSIKSELNIPLCIEFPGFTEGTNFHIGKLDAFDYFADLAGEANVAVTIDVGHILSYQWLRGKRGSAMFDLLDRLPLDRCLELHLSGCEIVGDKFRDLHHGVLMDEQIELLDFFLLHCPHLRAVTYEDPRFDSEGYLIKRAIRNFQRLESKVNSWASKDIELSALELCELPSRINEPAQINPIVAQLNSALYSLVFKPTVRHSFLSKKFDLFSDEIAQCLETIDLNELAKTGRRVSQDLLGGNFEGGGGLRRSYPGVFAALKVAGIDELDIIQQFCDSTFFDSYREISFAGYGLSLEESFFMYLNSYECFLINDPLNAVLLKHEFFFAMLSVLAVTEMPAFQIHTSEIRRTSCSWFAIHDVPSQFIGQLSKHSLPHRKNCETSVKYLFAATGDNRLITGPVDLKISEILNSAAMGALENRIGYSDDLKLRTRLIKMRLIE